MVKNEVELEGFRQCHIRDGAALISYFAWLEEQLLVHDAKITEWQAADHLESLRASQEHFRGLSFPTISSTGPNAAIIHYSPDPKDCATIDQNQIYLCDSGAQYTDGTTDVTRTVHFTSPTEKEIRAFTRVLQGHINLDMTIFPEKVTGYQLDRIARRALWGDGLDYRHGTGHGVGHFLNVHEGPQSISVKPYANQTHLIEGMVCSNEPGYYEDGKFGIRIENLVMIQKATPKYNFGDQAWFRFEHITMAPIQTKLVDKSLLAVEEVKWLNDYHSEVLEKVAPVLEKMKDERALRWLRRECQHI